VFEVGHVVAHAGEDSDVVFAVADERLHGGVDEGGDPGLHARSRPRVSQPRL